MWTDLLMPTFETERLKTSPLRPATALSTTLASRPRDSRPAGRSTLALLKNHLLRSTKMVIRFSSSRETPMKYSILATV